MEKIIAVLIASGILAVSLVLGLSAPKLDTATQSAINQRLKYEINNNKAATFKPQTTYISTKELKLIKDFDKLTELTPVNKDIILPDDEKDNYISVADMERNLKNYIKSGDILIFKDGSKLKYIRPLNNDLRCLNEKGDIIRVSPKYLHLRRTYVALASHDLQKIFNKVFFSNLKFN